MRFGLPRSNSSSPVRGYRRGNSTFGLDSDSDSDNHHEYNAYDYASDSSLSSSSTSSSSSGSTSSTNFRGRPTAFDELGSPLRRAGSTKLDADTHDGRARDPEEMRQTEETVATIRLWTRHRDPYEEWEKKTRRDAFRTARKHLSSNQISLQDAQTRMNSAQEHTRAATHAKQLNEIQSQMSRFRIAQEQEENALRETWKAKDKLLWERIESVIQLEEGKVRAKLEAERLKREAQEKKRRNEEMKRKLEQEKQELEENQRKEGEERKRAEQKKKQEEEEEAKRVQDEQKAQKEQLSAEANSLGYLSASEDWMRARETLLGMKDNAMSVIKSNKELKSQWNKCRRQITPKIGQITNDEQSINQISTQLLHLIKPNPPHNPAVYSALCYSLAKSILLQAETEVTAEKRSAIPLARVTFNLLTTLDQFSEIFWAKIVQRVGGWPVPAIIPEADIDGRAWSTGEKGRGRGGDNERWRVMGYRNSQGSSSDIETQIEYSTRVSGVMRVYWEIVKVQLMFPDRAPLEGPFQINRLWTWFARILDQRALLQTAVGAELINTALEVLGTEAADIWGHQWIKILQLIYEGTSVGIFGQDKKMIGGDSAEGHAAKARVQMEVERLVTGDKKKT